MEKNSKKPMPRGKGNQKSRRPFSKEDQDDRKMKNSASKRIDNDPSWYTVNGQVLKDVSNFSFNNALGADVTIKGEDGNGGQLTYHTRLPGVMSILTVPTIGIARGEDAPVNIAARNIYSYVRHANSGHSNYDPADLMIYLLAMDSIYTYWSYLVRVYGVAQVYSQTNRYVGDAYLRSMGVDPYSIRTQLADFRAFINMFAVKASVFCVPKTMTYFVRHSWMYSNIYKDEDISKAQVYMYVPAFLYKYMLDTSTGAGYLSAVQIAAMAGSAGELGSMAQRSVGDLISIGYELLNAMMTQEDTGIMSGDILKAYGAENLWKMSQIPEDYAVFPVFSEEVLAQIHNTNFASRVICKIDPENPASTVNDFHGLDIKQMTDVGTGYLVFDPIFSGARHLCHNKVLDFWKETPTPEDIIVATRNMLGGDNETALTGSRLIRINSCGSEIALCAFVCVLDTNSGNPVLTQYYLSDAGNAAQNLQTISKFNEYPIYYQINTNTNAIMNIVGEIGTYTVVTDWEIAQMHTAALLSMFGVPYIK